MAKGHFKHTKEKAFEEAKKYDSKKNFKKYCYGTYAFLYRQKLLNEACNHMKKLGNKKFRYVYTIELDNIVYVGLTMDPNSRFSEHSANGMDKVKDLINKGAKMILKTELLPAEMAAIKEGEILKEYKNKGYIILNRKATGGLGGGKIIWNEEAIIKEAKKYETRKEFFKKSNGAYQAAVKLNIREQACAHMKIRQTWTKEKILYCSKKCKSIEEFRINYPHAYSAASYYKYLSEITKYMIRGKIHWTNEEICFEAGKYKKRIDFYKKSRNIYSVGCSRGIIDKVCKYHGY